MTVGRPERSGRPHRLRRLAGTATTVVVLAATVPVVAVLVTAWVRGWTIQAVRTGSMEPAYPKGSAVVLLPVDPADVGAGTVIGFQDPDSDRLVAHRVTRVVVDDEGRRSFVTRGDANLVDDAEPVPSRLVRGEVRWRVLGLGTLLGRLQDRTAQWAAAGIPVALLGCSELVGRRARRRRRAVPPDVARLHGEVDALQDEVARLRALLGPRPEGSTELDQPPGWGGLRRTMVDANGLVTASSPAATTREQRP